MHRHTKIFFELVVNALHLLQVIRTQEQQGNASAASKATSTAGHANKTPMRAVPHGSLARYVAESVEGSANVTLGLWQGLGGRIQRPWKTEVFHPCPEAQNPGQVGCSLAVCNTICIVTKSLRGFIIQGHGRAHDVHQGNTCHVGMPNQDGDRPDKTVDTAGQHKWNDCH